MVGTFVCLFMKLATYDPVSESAGKVCVRYSERQVCCCEVQKKAENMSLCSCVL